MTTVAAPVMDVTDGRFLMFVMDELAAECAREHDDVVRLTLGKSELAPHEPIVRAMVDAAGDYRKASLVHPGGLPQLRERLAEDYRRFGLDLPARRFVVGAGTSGIVRNLMQVLAGPGDEVLVPLPYYPLYPFTARLAGAKVRHYRIDTRTLRVDVASLAEAMTERTRLVVVNSPGNPLGNLVSREEFLEIDAAVAGRATLMSDEIYGNVMFAGTPYSAAELADELHGPLVVTDSFSKAHRMYARRVGYALVPEELVDPLVVIQHHTLLTADPVCQFGAIAALDNRAGVDELARLYKARRDYTLRTLAGIDGVTALPAQGSFYLTLDCAGHLHRHGETDSFALARRILDRVHVATVPGADFGLPDTLRLSYTASRYEQAIDRLATYFAGE